MARTGQLYVMSAPSGAGKTSLVKAMLKARPELVVSVSHTTRKKREAEVEGRDYHFVDKQQFNRLVAAGAFLEHASVFDNHYGTGRQEVAAQLAAGKSVLLEIDWQGARQVREGMPGCVSIFILPPSRAALEERLRARKTDSDEIIARRLRDAATDMSHCPEFDYAVVNDRFDKAVAELLSIVDLGADTDITAARTLTLAEAAAGQALAANRPEIKRLLASLVA